MNKYELVVILDAQNSQNDKDDVVKQAADAVNKGGGKVVNSQAWLEKHKLTYPIRKCSEGTYYLINFEGSGLCVDKIKDTLRLNESILRSAIFKSE